MRTIGYATSAADGLVVDDRLALEPLAKLGVEVIPFVWDEPKQELDRFDAIIIRSCWDYHLKASAFRSWIESLAREGRTVWNPPPIVLRTMNKRYLLDWEDRGATIPKTRYLSKDSEPPEPLFESDRIVVKPAVSLNGYETCLFTKHEGSRARTKLAELLRNGDALIQEYVDEIESEGELSLLFFDGTFSHAIQKLPKAGEFRVQEEHGGRRVAYEPPPALIEQAKAILEIAGERLLYARVDLVRRRGTPVLMELELIDPMLFLGFNPGAPERFAKAVSSWLVGLDTARKATY